VSFSLGRGASKKNEEDRGIGDKVTKIEQQITHLLRFVYDKSKRNECKRLNCREIKQQAHMFRKCKNT